MSKTVVGGIAALLLIVIGLFLWNGKGAWMIAGYNTSDKGEKAKYDEKALCRFVAKLMFVMAAFMLLFFTVDNLLIHLLLVLLAIIFLFGAIIYANTGNRFKKK